MAALPSRKPVLLRTAERFSKFQLDLSLAIDFASRLPLWPLLQSAQVPSPNYPLRDKDEREGEPPWLSWCSSRKGANGQVHFVATSVNEKSFLPIDRVPRQGAVRKPAFSWFLVPGSWFLVFTFQWSTSRAVRCQTASPLPTKPVTSERLYLWSLGGH